MFVDKVKIRFAELRLWVEPRWRWWLSEMDMMLPNGVRRTWRIGSAVTVIDVDGPDIVIRRLAGEQDREIARLARDVFDARSLHRVLAGELSKHWSLREPVVLQLASDTVLSRTLDLPAIASSNLEGILRYEIERQCPVDLDHIYFDYRVLRHMRRENRIEVALRIIKREFVDAIVTTCRQAGIDLAAIAFAGDKRLAGGGNFPVERKAALVMRMRRKIVPTVAALIALLLGAGLTASYVAGQRALDDLADRVAIVRREARTVEQLNNEIRVAKTAAVFLAHRKQTTLVVKILAETTQVLPDGSWLFEFEYQNGEARIRGFSNAAASLIARFDASPLFTDAQFRAPLMQGPTGNLERFDMSFKVKGGA